jgi:hypothetical protein
MVLGYACFLQSVGLSVDSGEKSMILMGDFRIQKGREGT